MLNFLIPYLDYLQLALNLGWVVILGASVALKQLPALQPYAPKLLDLENRFTKFLRWLPFLGFDPKTKQLEEIVINFKKEI